MALILLCSPKLKKFLTCNLKIRKLGQIVLDLSPTLTQLKIGEEEERQTDPRGLAY